ncbi:hypothetical protein GDO86_003789 [Hymenochirus boettgeri]|uniref:Uncharacterized protein n=1 Tax=Hymenochirus boettgeri TaxID=247094 RepID=A0A8T2K2I8_9PIPI|nr:hypothetical protein GDO86_003789 [Hymenochirus boettgeri]
MTFQIKLFFIIVSSVYSIAGADVASYVPQITLMAIEGKITSTTFALDKPQCIFGNTGNAVWLLVARNNVSLSITNQQLISLSPYSSFSTNGYYHVQFSIESSYTCSNTPDYIRVGNEANCLDIKFCNGPLQDSGPYRVKFVVLNGNNLVSASSWSYSITLVTGKSPSTIDTWPGKRSGGMIVLTSILSVLIAILTGCLVAAFLSGCKKICIKKVKEENPLVQAGGNTNNYKTHYASTHRETTQVKV